MKKIFNLSFLTLLTLTLVIMTSCADTGEGIGDDIVVDDDIFGEIDNRDIPDDDTDISDGAKDDDGLDADMSAWSIDDLEEESDNTHDDLLDLDDSLSNGQIDPAIYDKLKDALENKLDYISSLIESKIKNEVIVNPKKFMEMGEDWKVKINKGYTDPSPIDDHEAQINEVQIIYDGVEGHPSQHYEVVNSVEDLDDRDQMSSAAINNIPEQNAGFETQVTFN